MMNHTHHKTSTNLLRWAAIACAVFLIVSVLIGTSLAIREGVVDPAGLQPVSIGWSFST